MQHSHEINQSKRTSLARCCGRKTVLRLVQRIAAAATLLLLCLRASVVRRCCRWTVRVGQLNQVVWRVVAATITCLLFWHTSHSDMLFRSIIRS